MNNVVSTNEPREAVIYLASTNSKGRAGYATATSVKGHERKPYIKWFANCYEDKSRREAGLIGLFEALKNIQSKCYVTVYCNERFIDDVVIKSMMNNLDGSPQVHIRATGRLEIKVVKPEEKSPQALYLEKVSGLAKWARSTGCRLI